MVNGASKPNERLATARERIRKLIALGFAEADIAHLCDLSPSTITKVLDPHEARVLSGETLETLREVVNQAGRQRLTNILPEVAVRVLDTCDDQGTAIDPVSDEALVKRSREILIDLLLALTPMEVTPGVAAVLVQLGESQDGVHLIMAPLRDRDDRNARLLQLKAIEHEANELVRACRTERAAIGRSLRAASRPETPKVLSGHSFDLDTGQVRFRRDRDIQTQRIGAPGKATEKCLAFDSISLSSLRELLGTRPAVVYPFASLRPVDMKATFELALDRIRKQQVEPDLSQPKPLRFTIRRRDEVPTRNLHCDDLLGTAE